MFCVYCGTKLPDEARFCFMCGKKVELADNAENIVAANSGSIDEEGLGIEIQEAPTTSSSEKNLDTPELAIEDGPIEDAHDAFATANESGPDETSAEDQSSEQARGISESADENDHDEIEEAQGSNSAELDAPAGVALDEAHHDAVVEGDGVGRVRRRAAREELHRHPGVGQGAGERADEDVHAAGVGGAGPLGGGGVQRDEGDAHGARLPGRPSGP